MKFKYVTIGNEFIYLYRVKGSKPEAVQSVRARTVQQLFNDNKEIILDKNNILVDARGMLGAKSVECDIVHL